MKRRGTERSEMALSSNDRKGHLLPSLLRPDDRNKFRRWTGTKVLSLWAAEDVALAASRRVARLVKVGEGGVSAADTTMMPMAHHLGALNPLLLCQLRGANVWVRRTRPRPAGKWGVFVELFTSGVCLLVGCVCKWGEFVGLFTSPRACAY